MRVICGLVFGITILSTGCLQSEFSASLCTTRDYAALTNRSTAKPTPLVLHTFITFGLVLKPSSEAQPNFWPLKHHHPSRRCPGTPLPVFKLEVKLANSLRNLYPFAVRAPDFPSVASPRNIPSLYTSPGAVKTRFASQILVKSRLDNTKLGRPAVPDNNCLIGYWWISRSSRVFSLIFILDG